MSELDEKEKLMIERMKEKINLHRREPNTATEDFLIDCIESLIFILENPR